MCDDFSQNLEVCDFHTFCKYIALQLLLGNPDRILEMVQLVSGIAVKFTDLSSIKKMKFQNLKEVLGKYVVMVQ